jgi:hypothetical protein
MDPLSAGIGAAGSVLSSVIGNIGAKKREADARKANIEFWKMQNQYNLPKAQMQRLKEAGLNPNLIYGSSPAGASGAAGSISPAKAAPYSFENPINSAVQMSLAPLQGGKLQAETALALQKSGVEKLNKKLLKTNFDSLAELQTYRTQQAYQELLQSTIATNVANKTQIPIIEQEIAKLALINAQADKEKSSANVERFKSDLADKGININDNLIFRLLALAANAMGLDTKNLFNK